MATKTQLVSQIAEKMNNTTTKAHVKSFLDAFEAVIGQSLKNTNIFVFPRVLKIIRNKTEAKPERMARNPATGKAMMVPPKPAGMKLKARFLKSLKVEVGQLPKPAPKDPKAVAAPKAAKAAKAAAPKKAAK